MIVLDMLIWLYAYGGKMVANMELFSDYEPLNIGKSTVAVVQVSIWCSCRMMKRKVILNENRQRKTE